MHNRTEVIERLREWALDEKEERSNYRAFDLLTQAADLLEAGEGRVEYRVVADFAPGDCSITLLRPDDIDGSEAMLREAAADYRHGGVYQNPRAQKHYVHETEWTNLEEGEQ